MFIAWYWVWTHQCSKPCSNLSLKRQPLTRFHCLGKTQRESWTFWWKFMDPSTQKRKWKSQVRIIRIIIVFVLRKMTHLRENFIDSHDFFNKVRVQFNKSWNSRIFSRLLWCPLEYRYQKWHSNKVVQKLKVISKNCISIWRILLWKMLCRYFVELLLYSLISLSKPWGRGVGMREFQMFFQPLDYV